MVCFINVLLINVLCFIDRIFSFVLQTRVFFLLFLKYYLKYLSLTPCITKRNHVLKYHLIFFFCNFIIFFFLFGICSAKGAALRKEPHNSTVDVISGILKARKAESCSLQVCKFLTRNPIKDHFLEIFCKFKSTFIKFG